MGLNFSGSHTQIVGDRQIQLDASIVTIGAFDGVHRGHQTLIRRAVAEARSTGVACVVWTFDPAPKVFFGRAAPLSTLTDKIARLARLGPDYIVVACFNKTYCARSPEDFITDLSRLSPLTVHVGNDFRFGCRQAGDVTLLRQHFNVALADPVLCDGGQVVSSTRIRGLRADGQMAQAQNLQGALGFDALLAGRLLADDTRFKEETYV